MSFAPVLITPPTQTVVGLQEMKEHLRVTGDDEDAFIADLEVEAVAHLDGWHGVMGRAIMPQTWSQDFEAWGRHRLAMPDAVVTGVVGVVGNVETAADSYSTERRTGGVYVTAQGGAADCVRVTYTAQLPVQQLPAVKRAVKLLAGHWYDHRAAVVAGVVPAEVAKTVDALLAPLRAQTI